MSKKKFYISDLAGVTNALNMITNTYDTELKYQHKINKLMWLGLFGVSIYMWKNLKVVKIQDAKIYTLSEELNKLKMPKEGNMEPEGE